MRTFVLRRYQDVSGVSGVGDVAEGVEFHDGECYLSWYGALHATNRYENIETLIAIHGHDGKAEIIWLDSAKITTSPISIPSRIAKFVRRLLGILPTS